ncbi:alpha/beta fold hydrolase [Mycobacterium sp. ITM-2016-00318]|uniref:alpha/beta fold hydrolase n=1 Tax=Mycobacterium sp. ITM-2016-00318 TaxID=2099693 RepID=UPI000CF96FE0|nr:alpha/beta hydrolase [Mycobacterium sp. ITM-2016-00318]WNG91958.1 alpha/beta hydrolase [Mycobacterium sp. ITM-2016-00318]
MTLPALVLVHGGQHAADCWDATVDEIHRRAPDLAVLTLDLPGRRGKRGDLLDAHIDDWVDSLLADIDDADIGEFVIVGHSLAGLTVPGVVAKLGRSRVREMVLAAAFVPPQGAAVVDTLPGPIGRYTRRNAHKRISGTLPPLLAEFVFCNGMTRSQRRFNRVRFYPESSSIIFDKVDRSGLPDDVPRTWILTLRDRALSVASQQRSIAALGGVHTMLPMDTCHNLMVSEPELLAEVLVERCRLYR